LPIDRPSVDVIECRQLGYQEAELRTRVVKQPAVRRQEIVVAARDLFQLRGYEQTSMQDVMAQVGIAKGTIYHYFASKDALLEAVIEMLVEESVAGLGEMVDGPGGNAIEKIRALAAAARAATGRQADLLGQLHQPGNQGMHARILATSLLKQAPLLERLIRQGRRE